MKSYCFVNIEYEDYSVKRTKSGEGKLHRYVPDNNRFVDILRVFAQCTYRSEYVI